MVAAYHLIWTAYGWWLPNDPRGSSSHEIRQDILKSLGELHHGRKKVQPASADIRKFYDAARVLLKHELRKFSASEIVLLSESFANTIKVRHYTCYACAIMPDHIHMLIRKHRDSAEDMILQIQSASRVALQESGHFSIDHPVWGGPGWKVFLNSREDIARTVHYVEDNPIKTFQPPQSWPFVRVYDGWLPGNVSIGRPSPLR